MATIEDRIGVRNWHLSTGTVPLYIRIVGPGDEPPDRAAFEEIPGVHDEDGNEIEGLKMYIWQDEEEELDEEEEEVTGEGD